MQRFAAENALEVSKDAFVKRSWLRYGGRVAARFDSNNPRVSKRFFIGRIGARPDRILPAKKNKGRAIVFSTELVSYVEILLAHFRQLIE